MAFWLLKRATRMLLVLLCAPTSPARPSVPLSVAIERVLAAKRAAHRRPRYVQSLRQYLRLFAKGRESKEVSEFHVQEIEGWLVGRGEKPVTFRSNLGRLSALFAFCVRQGWCERNPCDRVEKPTIELKAPPIFSTRQVARCLVFTRRRQPQFLAWLALAVFAGIRPEECDRLEWGAVDLARGLVRIDAAASKVHRRRLVHLPPAAVAWLQLARTLGARLPLPRMTRRRCVHRLRQRLRLKRWPQDVLRHTAATYWLATERDAGRVALELGTSPRMLLQHYAEVVTAEVAARFWGLRPRAGPNRPNGVFDRVCINS